MAFLKKLFSGKDPVELCAEAETLVREGQHGGAKLVFEKALSRTTEAGERERIQGRVHACADAIAEARLGEAMRLIAAGQADLALIELDGAMEILHDHNLRTRVKEAMASLEREDATERAAEEPEITDEERLAALAGSWEEIQGEEYDSYGDALFDALLAMEREQWEDAVQRLEAIVEGARDPRYVYLELGRARIAGGDGDGGLEALRTFLARIGPDEGGEARLSAHLTMARFFDQAGQSDKAIEELEKTIEALPRDPRPFITLGQYLRQKGHAQEALEVLDVAINLLGDTTPDWSVYQERGLAHYDAGHGEEAKRILEGVVATLADLGQRDLPVPTAKTLAAIYEKEERFERAADMYRVLSEGHDRANHVEYHREAARLLGRAGMITEAERMLERALGLAGDESETGNQIRLDLRELSAASGG
ncbi:MAG: hypothetical protein KC416_10060 [Myxococcales bacterium]|nr:hypothetical protein [Myxococcales bacterium]